MGMIPAEAVEAAARAMFDTRDDPYDMDEWEDIDSTEREPYLCQARVALEAGYAPLLAFADERDNALGAIRSHITTYELRKLLGVVDE